MIHGPALWVSLCVVAATEFTSRDASDVTAEEHRRVSSEAPGSSFRQSSQATSYPAANVCCLTREESKSNEDVKVDVIELVETCTGRVLDCAYCPVRDGEPPDPPRWDGKCHPPTQDQLKKNVAYYAVEQYVKSGMTIALGAGSTAYWALQRVGELLETSKLKDIRAIATSLESEEHAKRNKIPLVTLDEYHDVDLAIDGADTVDKATLNLVKGSKGTLLREKMVQVRAKKFIVIVDDSKLADGLGPHFKVPVEVTPFCHEHVAEMIRQLPALKDIIEVAEVREEERNLRFGDGDPMVTDNGNYIIDLTFKSAIVDPGAAADQLSTTVGVAEHGLFLGMTSEVLVADARKCSVQNPSCTYSLKPSAPTEEDKVLALAMVEAAASQEMGSGFLAHLSSNARTAISEGSAHNLSLIAPFALLLLIPGLFG